MYYTAEEEDNDNKNDDIVPFICLLLSPGTNMCTTLRGKRTTSRLKEKKIPGMMLSQVRLGQRVQERKENKKRGESAYSQGEWNET